MPPKRRSENSLLPEGRAPDPSFEESLTEARRILSLPHLADDSIVDSPANEWPEDYENKVSDSRDADTLSYPVFVTVVKDESNVVWKQLKLDNIKEEQKAHFKGGLDKLIAMGKKYAPTLEQLREEAHQFLLDYENSFGRLCNQTGLGRDSDDETDLKPNLTFEEEKD